MFIRSFGIGQRAFLGDKTGKFKHLPGNESSFVSPISLLHDHAQLTHRHLDLIEADSRYQLHRVE